MRWLLAGVHLLALGVGLGAVWARGRSFASLRATGNPRPAFLADSWWGVAALLWISTGLWRLLAGTEKDTAYYFQNHLFLTKMALFGLVLVLEIRPMTTLIRWRRSFGRGEQPATEAGPALARLSFVQAWVVVLMVFLAGGMARGYGS